MSSQLITPSRPSSKKTIIGFVNLGCSKNQVDSEVMLGMLAADGFALTDNPKKAEVVIINTCGFIEEAKQESIDTIRVLSGIDCGRLSGATVSRGAPQAIAGTRRGGRDR
jgi:hypothetical protein